MDRAKQSHLIGRLGPSLRDFTSWICAASILLYTPEISPAVFGRRCKAHRQRESSSRTLQFCRRVRCRNFTSDMRTMPMLSRQGIGSFRSRRRSLGRRSFRCRCSCLLRSGFLRFHRGRLFGEGLLDGCCFLADFLAGSGFCSLNLRPSPTLCLCDTLSRRRTHSSLLNRSFRCLDNRCFGIFLYRRPSFALSCCDPFPSFLAKPAPLFRVRGWHDYCATFV